MKAISVRIPDEMMDELEQIARISGVSTSEVVRQAIAITFRLAAPTSASRRALGKRWKRISRP
jgi:predicted transcriptional regulator